MKNGMLLWNIILTAVAGLLLFLYLGNNKKTSAAKPSTSDTAKAELPTRIAYIDMDSVQENYTFAKEILDDIRKKEQDNSFALERMNSDYNKKLNSYSQQDQAAGLTQLSEAHQIDLMETQKKMNDRKQTMDQEYVKMVNQKELQLRNKIKDFLKVYNQTKNFSYIWSYEDRMFYYSDTTYNITSEVIKGLNDEYKKKN